LNTRGKEKRFFVPAVWLSCAKIRGREGVISRFRGPPNIGFGEGDMYNICVGYGLMDGFVPTVHQNCDVPAWVPRCTSEVKTNSLIDMRIKLHKILRLSIINFAVRGHSLIWESSGDNWIGLGGRVVKAHFNASHQSPCPPGGTCIPSSQIPVSAAARPGNISSVGYWVHVGCAGKSHTHISSPLSQDAKKKNDEPKIPNLFRHGTFACIYPSIFHLRVIKNAVQSFSRIARQGQDMNTFLKRRFFF